MAFAVVFCGVRAVCYVSGPNSARRPPPYNHVMPEIEEEKLTI